MSYWTYSVSEDFHARWTSRLFNAWWSLHSYFLSRGEMTFLKYYGWSSPSLLAERSFTCWTNPNAVLRTCLDIDEICSSGWDVIHDEGVGRCRYQVLCGNSARDPWREKTSTGLLHESTADKICYSSHIILILSQPSTRIPADEI